ncbi:PH domain-containing protein [Parafrankia discariae]|uniref:PH domain-containing protein n=1 Tax=Parafrankia discariae TaxID=365528 RepID=UPI0003AA8C2E|nr:PH domain-containing protein [Parafrankia discariae]
MSTPPVDLSWSPPIWRCVAYAAGGAALIAVAAVADLAWRVASLDGAGRLLVGLVGLGLVALAINDAVSRPALRLSLGGIDYVEGLRRRHLPWAAVLGARSGTLTHGRRLVHLRTLEIETIDGPVLLSRRALGVDPEQIAEALEELRLRLG